MSFNIRGLCWTDLKLFLILLCTTLVQGQDEFHPKAQVHDVTPNRIGNGGGVITVHGKEFALDTFNQFDASIGNKVDS